MKKTSIKGNPDIYHELIERRFREENKCVGLTKSINDDFYVDLLCVFHQPESFKAEDFLNYSLSSILLYLRQTHLLYTNKVLEEISASIEELSKSDKKFEKLQTSLQLFFDKFRADLEEHIQEEEKHLFPYIDTLIDSKELPKPGFDLERKIQLIDFLLHHDDSHEEDLKKLTLALNKTSSFDDSFAFRMLVNRLSLFELDLRIHAKMEEEVLMPMALALEKSILTD